MSSFSMAVNSFDSRESPPKEDFGGSIEDLDFTW